MYGCALFSPFEAQHVETNRPVLPPLRASTEAIQLQVYLVERPADDPLIHRLLWHEVDEVGATPPALRAVLQDNGLRVAQCGGNVPPSLQPLMSMNSAGSQNPGDSTVPSGRQLCLLSGQESEILVSEAQEELTVRFHLGGSDERIDVQQARGVLRVRPVRQRDGWVKLEFTPEIHYGEARMRHMPSDDGWRLKSGQKSDVRQALKFELTLNTGEMAIVSAADAAEDTLGQRFFRREQDGRVQQRLVIIRLTEAGRNPAPSPLDP